MSAKTDLCRKRQVNAHLQRKRGPTLIYQNFLHRNGPGLKSTAAKHLLSCIERIWLQWHSKTRYPLSEWTQGVMAV